MGRPCDSVAGQGGIQEAIRGAGNERRASRTVFVDRMVTKMDLVERAPRPTELDRPLLRSNRGCTGDPGGRLSPVYAIWPFDFGTRPVTEIHSHVTLH